MTHPRPTQHEGGHGVRRTWRNQNLHGKFGDTDIAYSSDYGSNDHGYDLGCGQRVTQAWVQRLIRDSPGLTPQIVTIVHPR